MVDTYMHWCIDGNAEVIGDDSELVAMSNFVAGKSGLLTCMQMAWTHVQLASMTFSVLSARPYHPLEGQIC